jgi:predicted metal-dependent phosphoesterase TrpH
MYVGWNKADLHIHSNQSDGIPSPEEIVEYAATRTDLRVIAVTDHNTIEGGLRAAKAAERYPHLDVIVGAEITSNRGHILGLYLTEDVPSGMSAMDTIKAIEAQGGVTLIPHPLSAKGIFGPRGFGHLQQAITDGIVRAVETHNALPYLGWANGTAKRLLAAGGAAVTGGSDAHVLRGVGRGYTWFEGETAEDVRRGIETCATRASEGRATSVPMALRYAVSYPRIRSLQKLNIERCRVKHSRAADLAFS